MPWFLTSIAPKEDLVPPKKNRCRASRTFGFFNTYTEAYGAVMTNMGNMQECLYEYLVLEYIEPGIHPDVHVEQWFVWNRNARGWDLVGDGIKPEEFVGIVNWALG